MMRQRFTALCKTAMVSSIMDSPSNLYKFLTMSRELFQNEANTVHKKCIFEHFWSESLDPQNCKVIFQSQKYLHLSKNIIHLENINIGALLLWKTSFDFLKMISKMMLPNRDFPKMFKNALFVISGALASFWFFFYQIPLTWSKT